MEYPVGVEMSNTYLSFEVTSAALKLVRDFMLVKEGENVVITADTSADFRVVEAVAGAAYSVGANPVIIHYPTSGKAYEEPIRPVADAVVHADVWIELAYLSLIHISLTTAFCSSGSIAYPPPKVKPPILANVRNISSSSFISAHSLPYYPYTFISLEFPVYTCLCIIPEFKEPEKYHSDLECISKKYSSPVLLSDFVI